MSIGLAQRGADSASLDRLIARADAARYAAKHAGRNRVAAGPRNEIASGTPAPPQWAGVN